MTQNTESASGSAAAGKKPRLAFAIATALGVGYIPKVSGTFGSILGILLTLAPLFISIWPTYFKYLGIPHVSHIQFSPPSLGILWSPETSYSALWLVVLPFWLVFLLIGIAGVWSTGRLVRDLGLESPPHVIVDKVSGQQLTFLLGSAPIFLKWAFPGISDPAPAQQLLLLDLLEWKYLILGFLAFQLFDIWRPFPIRRLKKLPGGWGIMADDWMAGLYSAILLRVTIHFLQA
jgi:phosphatidylglycerophosphatase A